MTIKEPQNLTPVVTCPYCMHHECIPLYSNVYDRLKISTKSWSFLSCKFCKAAILSPHPSRQDLNRYYPNDYLFTTKKNSTTINKLTSWLAYFFFYRFLRSDVTKNLSPNCGTGHEKKKILDIGCGMGNLLRKAVKNGFDAYGIDFSKANIVQVNTIPGVKAYHADIHQATNLFPAGSFDIVTAFHVLEHVVEPVTLLKQCNILLKENGELAIEVPAIDSLQAKILRHKWITLREAPRHLTVPSKHALEIACHAAGFRKIVIAPGRLFDSAGFIALSLLPYSAEHFQNSGINWPKFARLLSAVIILASLPWVWFESYICKRPATIILHAYK